MNFYPSSYITSPASIPAFCAWLSMWNAGSLTRCSFNESGMMSERSGRADLVDVRRRRRRRLYFFLLIALRWASFASRR
jgi:hypothetical protein